MRYSRWFLLALLPLAIPSSAWPQTAASKPDAAAVPYLRLRTPRQVLPDAQPWEGNEFPHTLSVLELKRDGFRYWGWMGSMRDEALASHAATIS